MAENTKIEWANCTFNPWIGCTKVSPACSHCYAERDMDLRYKKAKWGPSGTRVVTSRENWMKPLKWDREAAAAGVRPRVFCSSLADVFEDWQGPMMSSGKDSVILGKDYRASTGDNRLTMADVRAKLFELIDATPHLDWLLLTKRPENILRMWPSYESDARDGTRDYRPGELGGLRMDNVWLATSVENQEYADKRIPELLKCRDLVPVLFLSCEPLLGEVDLECTPWPDGSTRTVDDISDGFDPLRFVNGHIDWVIAGGESGAFARPSKAEWFRSLREQCKSAGVPFFFKQWGEYNAEQERVGKTAAGRLLDGVLHDGIPCVSEQKTA